MTYDASHRLENAGRVCTQELLQILETSRFEQVLTEYGGSMDALTFPQYLAELMEQRDLTAARLGEAALLSRSFAYQLCGGARAPSRDIVLRLAIVLALPVEEVREVGLSFWRRRRRWPYWQGLACSGSLCARTAMPLPTPPLRRRCAAS